MELPETRYATTDDGVGIAYQCFGEGSVDLVYMPHFLFNLDMYWDFEPIATWLRGLGEFARVLIHDPRGTGLSDREVEPGNVARRVRDLVAVLDHAEVQRTAVLGSLSAGAVGALMATTYPERTTALIWWHARALEHWAPDYPWGSRPDELEAELQTVRSRWGSREDGSALASQQGPTGQVDTSFQQWMGKMFRNSVTPARAEALLRTWFEMDVRSLLPSLQLPTLVLAREPTKDESEAVAAMIPGAQISVLAGRDHMPWFGDSRSVLEAVRGFLGAEHHRRPGERFLATVLFTDIVGSTERAAAAGDERWRAIVREHHRLIRGLLDRHGGTEMDTAGDGFYASFSSPGDALRCALDAVRAVGVSGIAIRAGVHTGEVHEVDGKLGGFAVVIGARICSVAGGSEVLASSTVEDLVAGSGFTFEDAGEHRLKGVPDDWRLYRVVS